MYLKRLDISGFKTFASKTEVEFTPGFMGVVGPNGSGKSNLTDAIRYCLGEQSAKVLRATRQDELIFAGTPHRSAAPFCSVTATFDNSDGSLPIEFSEVSITRKTSRDGDSQYYINKTVCRQRDIHELLMGSGIGPGSFSVLGRKEIDTVLSSDPGERRTMLEETAGTNRYRFRKKEAMRKLNQTKQNLTRLNDILCEVEQNVEESRKSLDRYERYKAAQDELKCLQLSLAWAEFKELKDKVEQSYKQTEKSRECSLNADKREEELKYKLAEAESLHNSVTSQMEALQTQMMTGSNELAAIRASFEGISEQDEQWKMAIKVAEQRLESAQQRLKERQSEYKLASESLPSVQDEVQVSKEQLRNCCRLLEEMPESSQTSIVEARARLAFLEDKFRRLEAQKAGEQVRAEQDKLRLEAIRQDIERLSVDIPQNSIDYGEELINLRLSIEEVADNHQKVSQDLQRARIELHQVRQKAEEAESLRFAYHKKVMELEGIVEERLGMPQGQRTVLKWEDPDVVGALGELITVKPGLESAIEAALGGHMFDIVTEDRQATTKLIERLKKARVGRVTFWPLDLDRQESRPIELPKVRGVVGRAMSLIEYAPRLHLILDQILGNTVVVQDMDSAYALYDKCSGRRPHIVTLQGEYVAPTGSVTGGNAKNERSGILMRQRQLNECLEGRQKYERALKTLAKQSGELQELITKNERELEQLATNHRESLRRVADIEAEQRRVEREREQVETSINRLEKERIELAKRTETHDKDSLSLEKSLADLEGELKKAQENLTKVQECENERTLERERLHQKFEKAEFACQESARKLEEKQRELESLLSRQREIEEDSCLAKQELDQALEERKKLEVKGINLKSKIAELEGGLQGDWGKLDELRRSSEISNEKIRLLRDEQIAVAKEARVCGEAYHRCLIEFESLNSSLTEVQHRLKEEYNSSTSPQLDDFDVEKSKSQARRLQSFLANFGSVNLGAREDYERLTARQKELCDNISDLQSASQSLESIIAEMDLVSITRFKSTFKSVNETFGRIFKEIFQGGWGRLELTDPDNLLESGVEIVACPPGKKLQNLTLFSSGERTLAASAFLLALLTHKPSPIVVLDELDAPLDDSNVEKIAKRFRDFSMSSQFLVITHNRKTMEYADRLYGVTMEEPGVSRMLSVELRDIGDDNLT